MIAVERRKYGVYYIYIPIFMIPVYGVTCNLMDLVNPSYSSRTSAYKNAIKDRERQRFVIERAKVQVRWRVFITSQ